MKKDRNMLFRKLYRYQTIMKYLNKSELLGYQNNERYVFCFLNLRLVMSFFFLIFSIIIFNCNYILSILSVILFYCGISYYLFDYRIMKRGKKLEKEAISFFEIFRLSLESGKSLIQGLKLTTSHVDSELAHEFEISLREISYGKSLEESLFNLSSRIPSDIIQNVLLNIIEAYHSGGDIITTLTKQIDFIQSKRVMDLKTEMNKIPIKISIVSVFLFIPLILLLVLAPVILTYFG